MNCLVWVQFDMSTSMGLSERVSKG